jgi:hypothetical protein
MPGFRTDFVIINPKGLRKPAGRIHIILEVLQVTGYVSRGGFIEPEVDLSEQMWIDCILELPTDESQVA